MNVSHIENVYDNQTAPCYTGYYKVFAYLEVITQVYLKPNDEKLLQAHKSDYGGYNFCGSIYALGKKNGEGGDYGHSSENWANYRESYFVDASCKVIVWFKSFFCTLLDADCIF